MSETLSKARGRFLECGQRPSPTNSLWWYAFTVRASPARSPHQQFFQALRSVSFVSECVRACVRACVCVCVCVCLGCFSNLSWQRRQGSGGSGEGEGEERQTSNRCIECNIIFLRFIYSLGHLPMSQSATLLASPSQEPPNWGRGLLHSRYRCFLPLPHVWLHGVQGSHTPQPPATGRHDTHRLSHLGLGSVATY